MTDPTSLPHNLDAERALLSCLIQSHNRIHDAQHDFQDEHFYHPACQLLFQSLKQMALENIPLELPAITGFLMERELLDKCGGPGELADIYGFIPTGAHYEYYKGILHQKAKQRGVIVALETSLKEVREIGDSEVETSISVAAERLYEVTRQDQKDNASFKEKMMRHLDTMEARARGELETGIQTRWPRWNRAFGGITPRMWLICGYPSDGKAQPLDQPVLTPSGFRPIGNLAPGDALCDTDGGISSVVAVHERGMRQVFKVNLSDGTSTRCCADHLWTFWSTRTGGRGAKTFTRSTAQLIEMLKSDRTDIFLPAIKPVEFSSCGELPLHPWLLGMLIGDGQLKVSGCPMIHKPEADLLAKVESLLPEGDSATIYPKKLRIKGGRTFSILKEMGLCVNSHEKFIPPPYKMASKEARLELLRGLVDSDGSVARNGCIDWTSTSHVLAEEVAWLARSLGAIVITTDRITRFNGANGEKKDGRRSWRLSIKFPDHSILPFSSEKHHMRFRIGSRQTQRKVVSIVPDGFEQTRCITVSASNSLYLTNDFIPTHNSTLAQNMVEDILVSGGDVLWFIYEMDETEVMDRLVCARSKVDSSKVFFPRDNEMNREEQKRVSSAIMELASFGLHLRCEPTWTIEQIVAETRALKRKNPNLKAVVADYLQLIPTKKDFGTKRSDQVAYISRMFKRDVSAANGIAGIMLSQLNDDGKVLDSRAASQDSSNIVFVEPEKEVEQNKKTVLRPASLYIGKNRNGQKRVRLPIRLNGQFFTFEEYSPDIVKQ